MPRPLVLLLAAVAIVELAWTLVVPPFQAPDEPAHFAYTQSIVERGARPDEGPRAFSTEQIEALSASNAELTAGRLAAHPPWDERAEHAWEAVAADLAESDRGDGGGSNPAGFNPPLYYLYEAAPYVVSGGDLFDRLTAMRLWSALLLLVTTAAAWLLAGEIFGRNRLLQLVTAAAVGLQPMVGFVSASVNPDAMVYALWALAFWLGARVLRGGLRVPDALALGAVTGLAVATKGTSVSLLVGVLLVYAIGGFRILRLRGTTGGARWTARRRGLVAGGVATAGLAAVAARVATGDRILPAQVELALPAGGGVRELLSYVWQFYLPRLPFQDDAMLPDDLPWYEVWIVKGWGAFGWLEVRFPDWVYVVLAAVTIAALVGAGAALMRRRSAGNLWPAAFFAAVTLALLAGLHWTEYRELQLEGRALLQGRYVLPLAPLGGLALAASLTLAPVRRRALLAGIALGGLAALQALSLAVTMERFYA